MGTSCTSLCHADHIAQAHRVKEQAYWHEKMRFSPASQDLFKASVNGDVPLAQYAIENLADAQCCTAQGLRPLQMAIISGRRELISVLLKSGVDLDLFGQNTPPPIILAAASGDARIFEMMLNAGVNLLTVDDANRETALTRAAACGHTEVVQLILRQGTAGSRQALAQVARNDLSTAMHLAAAGGHSNVCEHLLGVGADPNASDREGRTPLHLASRGNHGQCASILIASGAEVSKRDRNADTPLHIAAELGLLQMASLLLRCSADFNAIRPHGLTPLHLAAMGGQSEICQLLIKSQANPDVPNRAGATPFTLAFERAHVHTCRALLRSGASPEALGSARWSPPFTEFDPHEHVKLRGSRAINDDYDDFSRLVGC